jgi:hypothetical protein
MEADMPTADFFAPFIDDSDFVFPEDETTAVRF